ncbi:hypothetical protein AB0I28_32475 [Phytomonospora sp. NPDC050363]|uniref:hypothetical protein n=1 Tax=Phytomonospora sp. NPDC050363 TaxID=3155642 RepID=UPI0033C2B100
MLRALADLGNAVAFLVLTGNDNDGDFPGNFAVAVDDVATAAQAIAEITRTVGDAPATTPTAAPV